MSDDEEIPILPSGTVLKLQPGDATDFYGLPPDHEAVMVVHVFSGVRRRQHGHTWVAVAAHEHPACTWDGPEPHGPCVELLVRADVLRRHAG